jgi:hypothetical protein
MNIFNSKKVLSEHERMVLTIFCFLFDIIKLKVLACSLLLALLKFFFAFFRFEGTFKSFFKKKEVIKKSQNRRNHGLLDDGRIRIRDVQKTSGSTTLV